LKLNQEIANQHKHEPGYEEDGENTHRKIAGFIMEQLDQDHRPLGETNIGDAHQAFQAALKALHRLAGGCPDRVEYGRWLAACSFGLGRLGEQSGRPGEAMTCYLRTLENLESVPAWHDRRGESGNRGEQAHERLEVLANGGTSFPMPPAPPGTENDPW